MNSFVRSFYIVSVSIILGSSTPQAFGQSEQTAPKGYVKMEIGVMGLHCPFLGVTLKEQLAADSAYSELKVDKSDHFLTFAYTKTGNYSPAYFQNIAVGVGYPAEIVKITLHDTQPVIEVRKE